MPSPYTGYDILKHGEADNERLGKTAITFASPPNFRAPAEIDPRQYLRVENQGSYPSCTGHAITTCCECIGGLQAGDFSKVPQLSRKFAWENGQMHWLKRVSWQDGCTIADVVTAAIDDGICPEQVAPYEFSSKSTSPAAYSAAKAYRAQRQTDIRSWSSQGLQFLGGGFGAIIIGVLLSNRMMSGSSGVWSLQDVREDGSQSGHAMAIVGYLRNGIAIVANSWAERWGNHGYVLVDADAMDYLMARPYTVSRGVTDLTGFSKPRLLKRWG